MSTFAGWGSPNENWFKTPKALIYALPIIETVSELKILNYVICHTWGYHDYLGSKLITMDEFENGRKRKDGSRIDGGTGLTINSIRDGIARAVEHGLLRVIEDDRDAARKKRYYKLADDPGKEDEAGESLPPNSDDGGQSCSDFEDQRLILEDQRLILSEDQRLILEQRKILQKETDQKELKGAAGAEKISEAEVEPQTTTATASVTAAFDFNLLSPDDPNRIEHERLLGIVRPEDRRGNSKKDQRIVVNDAGLTERLRTALVNELIKIKKAEALIALDDEDDLIAFQQEAEKLYRMGVDTPEKMKALGQLWDSRNSIPPHGKLLLKFQSQLLAEMVEQKNGKSSTNKNGANNYASNGRGRGNHAQTGGRLAQWEQEHGEITWEQQVPEAILSQWPKADKLDYQRKWQASYDNYHAAHAADEPASDVFDLQGWLQEQSFAGAAG